MTGLNQTSNFVDKKSLIDKMILQSSALLDHFIEDFCSKSFLSLNFGIESEFYLDSSIKDAESFIQDARHNCSKIDLFSDITPEKGNLQFEYVTFPTRDVAKLIESKSLIDNCIHNSASFKIVDFSARPYQFDCTSSLQLSFSVFDKEENYIFSNKKFTSDLTSFLTNRIDDLMIFSNSCDEDFSRYDIDFNRKIHKDGKFVAPTVRSWGFDNRSCAIRVVRSDNDSSRVEIRLPSNNCQFELLCCVLYCLLTEFLQRIGQFTNVAPIYGNAFDEDYNLPKLLSSQEQAIDRLFKNEDLLRCFLEGLNLSS